MSSDAAEHIPDEQRLLSGKRRSRRIARQLDVRLYGHQGATYDARTVDVSRGGMLLELTDPAFQAAGTDDPGARFVAIASLISTEFADGVKVRVGSLPLRSKAQVIRLVTRMSDMAFLLGCRFTPDLADAECRHLGLDRHRDETQEDAVLEVGGGAQKAAKPSRAGKPDKRR